MPTPGFTIPVEKITRTVEEVAPEMWQLSLERGDSATPTRITALFRATDEAGRYREDLEVVRREMVDLPSAQNPVLHDLVTLMRQCIIKAVIPDTPEFQALGVVGLSIEQAGPVIMHQYFTLLAQETASP